MSKRKSLKNFFANQETKEKKTASVEDDNLLKNILGELDSPTAGSSTLSNSFDIVPKPMRSIRKQATESEIEMKKYMDRVGKKAQEVKKKSEVMSDVS